MRSEIRKTTKQRAGLRPLRRRRYEDAGEVHQRALPESPPEAAGEPDARTRRPGGPEDRELRAGGPQDSALYVCRCGSAFQALVSASLRCPHCGEPQAW